jgi:hypothetical protein
MPNANKIKGSNAERYYAKIFRNLGFLNCVTSRHGSRKHDELGIDLINIPFNIQIKAGRQKGLNPISILSNISMNLSKLPEGEREYPLILIHKRDNIRGKKRSEYDDMVFLSFENFLKIIK